jgi:cation diffusion facilitator CzcD-associated flavoprotein CzcO
MQDYYTPSTSLFNDYCQDCIDRYSLNNLVTKADVHSIEYDEYGTDERPDNCFTIKTSTGTQLARTVVLAIGPGLPAPPPFTSNEAEGACHTSQLLKQECLAPHVKRKVDSKRTTNAIVIGGGLTSAQIVDLCIKKGVSKVWHIMRDNFKIKHFDLSLDWVAKYKNINQAAFWSADTDEERFEMILSARNGGSITPAYKAVLESHQTKGKVFRYTKTQIVGKSWDSTSKLWTIQTEPPIPDLPPIDYIYYATGAKADIKAMPLLQPLLQSHPIETVGGLPCLTYDMQWSKDVPLFVTGRLAGLQLGPGAANLEGARAGAERIAWRLQEILGEVDGDGDCNECIDEMEELRDRAERSWTHLNMFDTLSVRGGD